MLNLKLYTKLKYTYNMKFYEILRFLNFCLQRVYYIV